MKKEAEKQARILSTLGKRTTDVEEDDLQEESNDELCNLDEDWEDSFMNCATWMRTGKIALIHA